MQKLEKAGEPTMEEILASIRQIISEEPATRQPPAPLPGPQPTLARASLTQPLRELPLPMATPGGQSPAVPTPPTPPPAAAAPLELPVKPAMLPVTPPLAPTALQAATTAPQLPPVAPPPASSGAGTRTADAHVHGLSDSLNGPPRQPSAGIAESGIAVAQSMEQYNRSMWRFGKRSQEPQPAPAEAPAKAEAAAATLTAPGLAVEAPAADPAAAQPSIAIVPEAPPVLSPGAANPPAAKAPGRITSPLETAGDAPAKGAAPSRIAPSSDMLAAFVPGRAPSIVGAAADLRATSAASITDTAIKTEQPAAPTLSIEPLAAAAAPAIEEPVSLKPPPLPPIAVEPALDATAAFHALAASLANDIAAMPGAPLSVEPLPLSDIATLAPPQLPPLPSMDPIGAAPGIALQPSVTAAAPATAAAAAAPLAGGELRTPEPGMAAETTDAAPAPVKVTEQAGGAVASQPVLQQPAAAAPALVQAMLPPVKSLEDVVVDLLRPMLRQWLDDNMPRIIEKSLRIELAEALKKVPPQ